MKFIYTLIIGLVLFNGFLLAFSGFFPQDPAFGSKGKSRGNIANVTENETLSGYGTKGLIDLEDVGVDLLLAGATTMTLVIVAAIAGTLLGGGSNFPLWVGIGVVVGIISNLWFITAGVLTPLLNYPVVSEIYTIITIVIGILVVLGLVDMTTQRSDSDL